MADAADAWTPEVVKKAETDETLYTHEVFPDRHQVTTKRGERFIVREHLEYGAFGSYYLVTSGRGQFVMVTDLMNKHGPGQNMYRFYNQKDTGIDWQRFFWGPAAVANDTKWKYFFFNNIGRNVADVRKYYIKKNFSTTDALCVAFQMYRAIDGLHNLSYVHGDLTLCSFSFGVGDSCKKLFLTYFGRFRQHMVTKKTPFKARSNVPFFPRNMVYAPRSAHNRKDHGRMDDYESWLYIVGDLFDDSLPEWKTMKKNERGWEREKEILKRKEEFMIGNQILQSIYFDSVPKELIPIVQMINAAEYKTEVDQKKIRKALQTMKERIGMTEDYRWVGHELDTEIYPKVSMPKKGKEKEKEKEKEKLKEIMREKEKTMEKEREKQKEKVKQEEREKEKKKGKETSKMKELNSEEDDKEENSETEKKKKRNRKKASKKREEEQESEDDDDD